MEERVTHHMRELYHSANGDHWYLVRDDESEEVFVTHRPNAASGGQSTDIELGTFLSQNGQGPQHQALLRLIGSLVKGPSRLSVPGAGSERATSSARRLWRQRSLRAGSNRSDAIEDDATMALEDDCTLLPGDWGSVLVFGLLQIDPADLLFV